MAALVQQFSMARFGLWCMHTCVHRHTCMVHVCNRHGLILSLPSDHIGAGMVCVKITQLSDTVMYSQDVMEGFLMAVHSLYIVWFLVC